MKNYTINILLVLLLTVSSSFATSAIPGEQLKKQLVGTSWYCDSVDYGLFFEDTLSCYLIKYLECKCTPDKFYLISSHWFYDCTDSSQICLYDSDGHWNCDDGLAGFFCLKWKFFIEEMSNATMDLRCVWYDSLFINHSILPLETAHYVKNTTLQIEDNSFFEQSETLAIDSTIQIPKVVIRNQQLAQIITDFGKRTAIPSDTLPFLEARCHREKDSLVVTITEEVTVPYDEKTMQNSVMGTIGSIPVVFVGDWPKQMFSRPKGNVSVLLSYFKHIRCHHIFYAPSDKYLKKGKTIKKKIALK